MPPLLKACFIVTTLFFLTLLSALGYGKGLPLESIRPMEWYAKDAAETERKNWCTIWATQIEGRTLWVTAYHCVRDEDGQPDLGHFSINKGKPLTLVKWDAAVDLAAFSGPAAKGLPVAFGNPQPRDPIWTIGYPGGSNKPHVTAGVYSLTADDDGRTIWNVAGAGGMSGSPIMAGELVVGVLLQVECDVRIGFCPITRGTGVPELRAFLQMEG